MSRSKDKNPVPRATKPHGARKRARSGPAPQDALPASTQQQIQEILGERATPALLGQLDSIIEWFQTEYHPDTAGRPAGETKQIYARMRTSALALKEGLDTLDMAGRVALRLELLGRGWNLHFDRVLGLPEMLDSLAAALAALCKRPLSAGHPREQHRRFFVRQVGYVLRGHGLEPGKTRDGWFDQLLRVLLRKAGFSVPDDLMPIMMMIDLSIDDAIPSVPELWKPDPAAAGRTSTDSTDIPKV